MKKVLKKLAPGTWTTSVSANGLKGIREASEALKRRAADDLEVSESIDRSLQRLARRDSDSDL